MLSRADFVSETVVHIAMADRVFADHDDDVAQAVFIYARLIVSECNY